MDFFLLRDGIFKTMFKESKNFRKLLNEIFIYYFQFNLEKYHLTSEELTIINKGDKKNKVDLLLTVENENAFLNIEANIGNRQYYKNRNLMYQSKIVLYIFQKNSDYKKKFKVIQININDIKCPIDEEIISSTMTMYDRRNEIKDERIITHNLYLGKLKKLTYNKLSEMEKNLAMLICSDLKEMEKLAKGNKLREEVMKEYKRKISDEEFLAALFDPEWDRQMIINSERKEALEKGIEQGKNETSIAIAKEMINENMPIEKIARITKLSVEEVAKLQ